MEFFQSDRRSAGGGPEASRAAGKAPVLKHSRWLLLKRPEHLTDAQRRTGLRTWCVATCARFAPTSSRRTFNGGARPRSARGSRQQPLRVAVLGRQSFSRWCTRTMRSRLDPMKEVARMVRSHRDLILNWFRARGQFSSGVVEGFNGKARVPDHQTGVWVPHPRGTGSRLVSCTWTKPLPRPVDPRH